MLCGRRQHADVLAPRGLAMNVLMIVLLEAFTAGRQNSAYTYRNLPIQDVAYSVIKETWSGPVRQRRVRVEYDRGRFRETTLTNYDSAAEIRVYDRNPQRLCYIYIPTARGKSAGLDLTSYSNRLALANPAAYRDFTHTSTPDKHFLVEPHCSELRKFVPGANQTWKLVGKDAVDGKQCDVYQYGDAASGNRICVWKGWILEEAVPSAGRKVRIVSVRFVDKLPMSTFSLPAGYSISAPRFAHVTPPKGVRVKEYLSKYDGGRANQDGVAVKSVVTGGRGKQ
jgi:hypothetical protein